jgi:hypothetical protein
MAARAPSKNGKHSDLRSATFYLTQAEIVQLETNLMQQHITKKLGSKQVAATKLVATTKNWRSRHQAKRE